MPGTVYGAGDHSGIGAQLKAAYDGIGAVHRLREHRHLADIHVDDIAGGIVAALDRGRLGEAYILTATNMGLGEAMRDRGPARPGESRRALDPERGAAYRCPSVRRIRARSSASPRTCARSSSSADGVTYWASNAKAVAELGFVPRSLEVGLVDAFGTD